MAYGVSMSSMVAVGDSLVNAGRSWAFHLAEAAGHDLTRLCVGGAKSADVVSGQLKVLVGRSFQVGVLSVGANDALSGVPVDEFRENLSVVLEYLGESSDRVVVQTIPSGLGLIVGSSPGLARRVAAINSAIEESASRSGAMVVDARDLQGRVTMSADRVHPSEAGQLVIFERAATLLGMEPQERPAPAVQGGYARGTVKVAARSVARRALRR